MTFSAYAWLLRNAPAPLVGTYAFVNPVVAVALGSLLAGEPLTPRVLAASALIVAAAALVVLGKARATAPRRLIAASLAPSPAPPAR